MKYAISVRYRTNSGCNTRTVFVDADSLEQAMQLAPEKVRNRRGVIKIDGCDGELPPHEFHKLLTAGRL